MCEKVVGILRDKIISLLAIPHTGYTFDELRETLESEGLYIDSVCLRKILSDLIRRDLIKKCFSKDKHNRFVFKINC
ncbi:MAG: hypothetical protein ACP5GI_02345 [Sulfolobales archaeon]